MAISATWNSKRVFITYRNPATGLKEGGTWTADFTGRVTNTLGDGTKQVFRKGRIATGALNTVDGVPSIDIDLPVTDDPDNSPLGGEVTLTVTFSSGGTEVFHLSPLLSWPAGGTDLALILDPEIIPSAPTYAIVGVPGGVAKLGSDGLVRNADGSTPSGGGGAVSSVAGKTGAVTLTKADVALGSVQNINGKTYGYSTWNPATSAYEPVRDPEATEWTYRSPAGAPAPSDSNGGLGRKADDVYRVRPNGA